VQQCIYGAKNASKLELYHIVFFLTSFNIYFCLVVNVLNVAYMS